MNTILSTLANREYVPVSDAALESDRLHPARGMASDPGDCDCPDDGNDADDC